MTAIELWRHREDLSEGVTISSVDPAVELLLSLWRNYHAKDIFKVCWLIETQLREMKEAGYTKRSAVKELPDIIIICLRELVAIGVDPGKALMNRLEGRHRGQIDTIYNEYEQKFRDEFQGTLEALRELL